MCSLYVHRSIFQGSFPVIANVFARAGRAGCVAILALTALTLGVLCP
jgi:hypothetical protein